VQVVLMLQLQPWLLEMPEAEMEERLQALTAALCLPPRVVQRLCCASPATLRYEPAAFRGRLLQLATLLDVPLVRTPLALHPLATRRSLAAACTSYAPA
jgi:hypothetical protein